jgi:hypothetical protein
MKKKIVNKNWFLTHFLSATNSVHTSKCKMSIIDSTLFKCYSKTKPKVADTG